MTDMAIAWFAGTNPVKLRCTCKACGTDTVPFKVTDPLTGRRAGPVCPDSPACQQIVLDGMKLPG